MTEERRPCPCFCPLYVQVEHGTPQKHDGCFYQGKQIAYCSGITVCETTQRHNIEATSATKSIKLNTSWQPNRVSTGKKFPSSMELYYPLTCSQELATGFHLELDESIPRPQTRFVLILHYTLPSTPRSTIWSSLCRFSTSYFFTLSLTAGW